VVYLSSIVVSSSLVVRKQGETTGACQAWMYVLEKGPQNETPRPPILGGGNMYVLYRDETDPEDDREVNSLCTWVHGSMCHYFPRWTGPGRAHSPDCGRCAMPAARSSHRARAPLWSNGHPSLSCRASSRVPKRESLEAISKGDISISHPGMTQHYYSNYVVETYYDNRPSSHVIIFAWSSMYPL
jgi:hypothetical protein